MMLAVPCTDASRRSSPEQIRHCRWGVWAMVHPLYHQCSISLLVNHTSWMTPYLAILHSRGGIARITRRGHAL
eukprot:scaffold619_cov403-Prasinococcus_capsulatus_cf.AAC.13